MRKRTMDDQGVLGTNTVIYYNVDVPMTAEIHPSLPRMNASSKNGNVTPRVTAGTVTYDGVAYTGRAPSATAVTLQETS